MDSDGDSIILKAILSTPEKETDPEITTSPSDETSCSEDKKEEGAEEDGGEGGTGISTCEPVDSSVGNKSEEDYEASVEKGITNDSDSVFKEEGGVVSEDVACSTNNKSGRWYLISSLCFCISVPQKQALLDKRMNNYYIYLQVFKTVLRNLACSVLYNTITFSSL